jgi:putative hydrolases of HD superfamily
VNNPKLRAQRLLELQTLLIQFAEVERLIHFPDRKNQDRFENDAEHSYNLAIAAWYLSSFFPHLDRDKLIRYALAHDLVEVYAGDEMAVGRTDIAEKAKSVREAAALQRLEKEWSDFSDFTSHIRDYEKRADSESKFIYALDKLMPMMLNIITNGKTWKTYKLGREAVLQAKDSKVPISPEINELWHVFRKQILENPDYFAHDKNIQ